MSRADRVARRAANRLGIAAMLAHSPRPWRSRIAWTLMGWVTALDPRIHMLVVGGVGQPMPDNVRELIALSFGGISRALIGLGQEQQAQRDTAAAIDRARASSATPEGAP
jgi:hypothetical protein